MGKTNTKTSGVKKTKMPPAKSPEEQEQRMISAAMDLAEQQLLDGTASSQVICHYLKLASTKDRAEKEKLQEEIKLLRAKTKSIESGEKMEKAYTEALQAMREYSGHKYDEDI